MDVSGICMTGLFFIKFFLYTFRAKAINPPLALQIDMQSNLQIETVTECEDVSYQLEFDGAFPAGAGVVDGCDFHLSLLRK